MDRERLVELEKAEFLSEWEGSVPDTKLSELRTLANTTVRRVIPLNASTSAAEIAAVLVEFVERVNAIDDGFIMTIEREDLCDFIQDVGMAAGLSEDEANEIVDHREW